MLPFARMGAPGRCRQLRVVGVGRRHLCSAVLLGFIVVVAAVAAAGHGF